MRNPSPEDSLGHPLPAAQTGWNRRRSLLADRLLKIRGWQPSPPWQQADGKLKTTVLVTPRIGMDLNISVIITRTVF
jgi:hypothetical protein